MKKKRIEQKVDEIAAADGGEQGKMTIYEYEEKYTRRQNAKGASFIIKLIAAVIGVFLAWCLFSLVVQIHALNEYAGYGAAAAAVVLYIFLFIVPLVRILKLDYFVTNVNSKSAGAAQRHNRELRRKIASKMVDFHTQVSGAGWYESRHIDALEIALKHGDDQTIKGTLTALYQGSVKKSAKDVIFKCSLKSAMYSAVSQTSRTDAALVAFINLQMIKDIVFLYGFRPSDARLVKIFGRVVQNSLIAYGLGGVNIGSTVAKTMGDAAKGIPFLGSAISALVDSSVQGLTNGTLTAVIGYQTIKYLNTEYRLQTILDGVEIAETEEELQDTCEEIERELKRPSGKKGLRPAAI